MFKINTIDGNDRMSTQDLLERINAALAQGETEFYIEAAGQHDIGGPLWHPEGKPLKFHVKNAGQRIGSMCLPGTEIIAEGSVSADVGWLNAGGRIIVKGDGGDTTAHCAAAGTIYVGGRAGTRSGSLMKQDPYYEAPEFWVLKNVGSFAFEFMGGGIAVVCGYDSEQFESVLGDRACTGMVGGIVYFRGSASGISAKDTKVLPLGAEDIAYLDGKMDDFLGAIDKQDLRAELSDWKQWKKVVPLSYDERPKKANTEMRAFRFNEWVPGSIFGDVCNDDFSVIGAITTGVNRRRVPIWENGKYSAPCEFNCTASIPSQQRFNLLRDGKIDEAYKLVLEYTPFPGSVCGAVCPNLCMDDCTRKTIDISAQIGKLGRYSNDVDLPQAAEKTGKHVAVIGGGAAGLTTAWQLARLGHEVTVFEADNKMGGKMEQVIPRSRLPQETLSREIDRIAKMGVAFKNGVNVDKAMFASIKDSHDAVVVTTGSHITKVIPWPGHERIVKGLEFLKAINQGQKPKIGKKVIVIGCGNSGMDVAVGAYGLGAEQVTCIDVQRPAAFEHEIDHVKALGAEILWPVFTKEVTDKGIVTQDDQLIEGDTVIIAIGEAPDLGFIPDGIELERGCLKPANDTSIAPGIFTAGDTIRPGRLVDAIGAGREAAMAVDAYLKQEKYVAAQKTVIPAKRLSTAYFKKCHSCDVPEANSDYSRCISCGTCRDCHMCLKSCPENAITRTVTETGAEYASDPSKCIGCGICAGICPCGVWNMETNEEPIGFYK